MVASPVQVRLSPARARRTVDLPLPLSPTSPKLSPEATENDTPRTARTASAPLPKVTTRSRTATA